jgi:hypothetical protein
MDLVKEAQKLRLQKIKSKNKQKLHGWILTGKESEYIKNKIFTTYENNERYVEVTHFTKDMISPFPKNWEYSYVGLIDEYLGYMPDKPNITHITDDYIYNKYIN